jgi:hypothetical protein
LFYSASPSIQSHLTNSPEDELLSTGTILNKETNDAQNQSILSFPDHDTPLSQQSEELINDDSQLRLDAQTLVDDSIQNAQEKYQRVENYARHYHDYLFYFLDLTNEYRSKSTKQSNVCFPFFPYIEILNSNIY